MEKQFKEVEEALVINGVLENDIKDAEQMIYHACRMKRAGKTCLHAENEVGMEDLFAVLNDQVEK